MSTTPQEPSSILIPFTETRCRPGDVLQLQLSGAEQRYPAKLIGYVNEKTILITAPGNGSQLLMLRENQSLTVRSFSGTSAYAYHSQIIRTCNSPLPYLHLSWPKSVHKVPIRGSTRVDYNLSGTALNLNQDASRNQYPVQIVDLSTSGAAFVASRPVGKKNDALRLSFAAKIHAIEVNPDLNGVIRSVQPGEDGASIRYGIQFLNLSLLDTLTLQGMVCQQVFSDH